ncbi:MAG: magnesium chelatase ATPase subunit I [Rubrivivax sp.]|nr:magnesium chelatase ATPase subunit I [Rubrivivax sp.]
MSPPFPFTAIVGQEDMRRALLITAVDPSVGGVLVFGDRGTGKSTAVRALAALLPPMKVVAGCRYGCEPDRPAGLCERCENGGVANGAMGGPARVSVRAAGHGPSSRVGNGIPKRLPVATVPVPVVDLPLGATEDRVLGALDLEHALAQGQKRFEPGLLARAHRGYLYIDEVNLLDDHLVDLLIDAAASGENRVEREGLSVQHPARFVLVGSGNPEEGELRPQLLDRFGLAVDVKTPQDLAQRVEVVRRRDAFERDAEAFVARWADEEGRVRRRLLAARRRLPGVEVPPSALERAAGLCIKLGTDGLRGELTLVRAARALAAYEGAAGVTDTHLRTVAAPALRHRLRRNPLDDTDAGTRVARAVDELFGAVAA